MTLSFSVAVRNAELDAIEATIGTDPVLKLRTLSAPTSITYSDTGDVLATMTLPSDWMGGATNGTKALSGTWSDTSCDTTGSAGHFRIYASDGTTQHLQGSVTATGGGGDMTLLGTTSIAAGQVFTITGFTLTAGNA
jgi:hypothetical protein